MSNRRPESHVAQQVRRDRLRIHNLEDFPNNLDAHLTSPGTSSDLVQVRCVRNANMLYEPTYERANFSTVPNPLVESTRLVSTMPQYSSLEEQCLVRNIGYWRNNVSHQVCDWVPNEGNPNNPNNPNSMFGLGITNELDGQPVSSRVGHGIMQEGSNMASLAQQIDHGMWVGNGNQFFFLPNHGNPNSSANPPVDSDENRVNESNNQGLSLSLSSNAQSVNLRCVSNQCSNVGGRDKHIQNVEYRNVGPLGPFTGYATILKNSSYLKPAQELLDGICGVGQSQSNEKIRQGAEVVNNVRYEISDGDGGNKSLSRPSSRLDYQQRMAKFLYMQEEVIRKHKQHQQQMQMIIPSFESVAGLGSATPYISKALKSVSRQFRSLENAISDQVKRIREILGEELSATTSGATSSSTSGKHDSSNIARLKFLDQSFQKNKFIAASSTSGYVEHQQNSWRPQQKGLPERAVSVLRAWLFDHFLHPYPTDADKHMLAARTGLSRNQVSNWFINARVRVWKPMVEEIHMLEMKGGIMTSDINIQNSGKIEGTCAMEGDHDKSRGEQLQCMESHMDEEEESHMEESNAHQQWNQEKRSNLECHMEGTLMGFVPYRRADVDVGGVTPVSLTLGLKHGDVEAIHHHNQLSRHFGGHVMNDFVG